MDAEGNGATLGLMDYHARFYDSALARFIQPDSIIPDGNPQSLNRYSYVGNNAINATDPSGHKCLDVDPENQSSGCSIGVMVE